LARLLHDAQAAGHGRLGAALAALTGEREVRLSVRPGQSAAPTRVAVADAIDRLELLAIAEREGFHPGLRQRGIDPSAARECAQVRDDLLRALGGAANASSRAPADDLVPRLLLAAYPDRVAKRAQPDANRAAMVGGVAIELDAASAVAASRGHPRSDLLLAVSCQGLGSRTATVVRQACELDEADLEAVFPGSIVRRERLTWDDARQQVASQIAWWYRDLAIRIARDGQPDAAAVSAFLAQRLTSEAVALFDADEHAGGWLRRYRWLAQVAPDLSLPAIAEADLVAHLHTLCADKRSRADVQAAITAQGVDLLRGGLSWDLSQRIDTWAPSHLAVPTGSRIRLDYSTADAANPPVLAVRLQELFGQPATPRIADGRIGVLLHLLGPNFRCEQVTRDLASFWANTYPQVRKDLRGRYPKHSWPDDPLTAPPVAKGRHREQG
jgi:ATP-dependent helicase HrpB